jgi:hypothetical protein
MKEQNRNENAVNKAYDLGQKICWLDAIFPSRTKIALSELKKHLDLLDDNDKKKVKNSIEKTLKKRNKRLIEKKGSLNIEKISEIRVSPKEIMKRRSRLRRFR